MIKDSKFMKIYSQHIIKEDGSDNGEQSFFNKLQKSLAKKLVPICTEQLQQYQQLVADKQQLAKAVEDLNKLQTDETKKIDFNQMMSKADQMAKDIQSHIDNNTLDQYFHIDLKERVNNKKFLLDFVGGRNPFQQNFEELFPKIYIIGVFYETYYTLDNNAREDKQWYNLYHKKYMYNSTFYTMLNQFKVIQSWLKSNISRYNNKVYAKANTSIDTGYKDRFGQSISIGDDVIFTEAMYGTIHIGRVEKCTASSIILYFKASWGDERKTMRVDDIKTRIINISTIGNIDWSEYTTANQVEI